MKKTVYIREEKYRWHANITTEECSEKCVIEEKDFVQILSVKGNYVAVSLIEANTYYSEYFLRYSHLKICGQYYYAQYWGRV